MSSEQARRRADAPSGVPGSYPPAGRDDVVEVLHGHEVPDPYRWLEDAASARTGEWAAAQDALFAAHAATWPGREVVRASLARLLATGSVGVAARRRAPGGGTREVLTRREPDQEHAVLLVRERAVDGTVTTERVLVDPVRRDPSGTTTLDAWSLSREGDLLAYQLSEGGSEESVLRVLDVVSGEDVDGPLDRARYSPVAWLPRREDGPARFYYVRRLPPEDLPEDQRQYHRRVYLHTVGGAVPDAEVLGDGLDLTNYYGVGVSHDGRWVVASASAGTAPRTDVWLADLDASDAAAPAWRPVAVGLDAEHGVWVGADGRLYVHTDLDAPRGRLCVADPGAPGPEHWVDLVAEDPTAVLTDVAVLDDPGLPEPRLLVQRTRHAVTELAVHRLSDGAHTADVALPGVGSGGALVTALEDRDAAWFSWTDHTSPARVLRLDGHDLALTEWEAPPGSPPPGPAVTARHVAVTSADGTTVRALVLARGDLLAADDTPRAPLPTVLYGYGGFGISLTPGWSASTLAWVRAGGVWVVANLRGGGEEGEDWHRAGYRGAKQRVFEDLEAVADTLVRDGWTTPQQLALQGGSNGGLLVGAALTRRPDAYAAVVCSAPLLDMVRYEKHGLGVTWNDEYGTAEDPEELGWLLGYSPYHRAVEALGTDVAYPSTLFTVFDGDSRVDPLHARKTAAAMQAATTGDPRTRPVLLRRERDVGHGARSVSRTLGLATDTLLFLAHHTGLDRSAGWSADPSDG
ncbi:prolyl oligopeptidase family serine peptidase [Aquipuribacter sp. SD81]|uniref:prolyl oligopeptidase family serine peptidase n=1 Tax=Aquipuribacter sp. SD81 TaxID=3127703 RepID=UPI00301A16A3